MFKKLLTVVGLATVPCFGAYDPKGFSVRYQNETGIQYYPKCQRYSDCKNSIAAMTIIMKNVPLYFAEKNGNRDYIRNLSVVIIQNNDSTYDLTYSITASRKSENLSLKGMQPETINAALKNSFPRAFKSSTKSRFAQDIASFYELQQSDCNKELFENLFKLINGILPVHKLHFDENDLSTPINEKHTGWRAWLNWLRGE